MRAFQEQNGLAPTGAPDRATLEALGIQASEYNHQISVANMM